MPESGFTLTVMPRTLEEGFEMVLGFREIKALENASEEEIKAILAESIGAAYVARLTKKLATVEDLEALSEQLSKGARSNLEYLHTMCSLASNNKDLIWLESRSGKLTRDEVCPDYMTIETRSKDYDEFYYTRIALVFDCHETQELKAAVFARAFLDAGYEIEESEAWDEYQGSGDEAYEDD